ncbi:MAG: hypothetical protein ACRDQH_04685 [Pseudonocardiaceae bacterium]
MSLHDELVELYRREGSAEAVMRAHTVDATGRCHAGCGGTVQTGHGALGTCTIWAAAKAATQP